MLEEMPTTSPTKQLDSVMTWILYVDEASNFQESRAWLILANPKGVVTKYILRLSFKTVNN